MGRSPLIVDIKRHSLEDGPGIRSVIFFKGCPLECLFCHNPETWSPAVELAHYPETCIRCGLCRQACENQAIQLDPVFRIDLDRCQRCGACARACPARALRIVGREYALPELMEILLRDYPFYKYSNGGVTLSGGECTMHPDYLEALLKELKAAGIHVLLETCGYFSYQSFCQKILPHVNMIYMDIKFADPKLHKNYTGRDNRKILRNIRKLLNQKKIPVHLRIPLVPGLTATRENMLEIAMILKGLTPEPPELLPYNPLGLSKWERLGKTPPDLPQSFMAESEIQSLKSIFGSD